MLAVCFSARTCGKHEGVLWLGWRHEGVLWLVCCGARTWCSVRKIVPLWGGMQ